MRSIIRFFSSFLRCLLTTLVILLLAYHISSATEQDMDKKENTESIKLADDASLAPRSTDIQDEAGINDEKSSSLADMEKQSPMLDSNVEKAEVAPDTEKNSPEQTVYPGVQNAVIIHKTTDGPSVEFYYPIFGNQTVDAAIKLFVEKQVSEYEKDIGESVPTSEEKPNGYEQWEMSANFNIERPNPNIVSVIFNIFSYSGGAHGNLLINCLNYNLTTGKPVDFADLFKDPEKALDMMSAFSAKKLNTELGEYADEDMILSGTSPDLSNFSNLSLVPEGLYIEFQPYQVGPWAAGPQRIKMTLQDLAAAGPEPDIWPSALNLSVLPGESKKESEEASNSELQKEQE